MKKFNLKKTTKVDFATYLGVIVTFIVLFVMQNGGMLSYSMSGMLVPICCFIVMAVSLNLTVGILGELSLGHAGFVSVGAFSGIIASQSLIGVIESASLRLAIALVAGAIFAAIAGVLVGIPVLRLRGDYLAIVTLAFGEIIKDLINCLLVGIDSKGLHVLFNAKGLLTVEDLHLEEGGRVIIKGAQGATGIQTISTFTAGFILIMITLVVVLNLTRSRSGRAIMALRDNRIAAESVGINVTKYKLMAFVTSAALAGAAGALYGLNFSAVISSTFNFNISIEILLMVVFGGLGNIWGSVIAAAVIRLLPELLREFNDYRMLFYAIILILVMIATNNPTFKNMLGKLIPKKKGAEIDG
ncbi:MAG: branched-chain amino acid ABC transporter permease [Clostridia bacterium]|nr:branched-chain amino acid ABC transporter permease [Clostridia bacterium]